MRDDELDELGGRLPLLRPDERTPDQQRIAERLDRTRVRAGRQSGYVAQLPDGRLIGPFNALLRHPDVADAQLDWVAAIAAADIAPDVRETVILTIAGAWDVAYVGYAHSRAGRAAGLTDADVERLLAGDEPIDVPPDALLAHRLTRALVVDHHVPAPLHEAAVAAFGESTLVALLALVGQYLTTSTLLTCFDVPAPE